MKKYVFVALLALVAFAQVEARGGRGGHRGGHRGGRGFRGHGRGHRGHGFRRRGFWGGPGFGVGIGIPLGGSGYVAPVAPAGDPYNRYRSLFPDSDPLKNKNAYRRWLFSNYTQSEAQNWWNYFLTNRYNPYRASRPRPSVYLSTGYPGYYGGGYYGRGYGRGYYGRPYGGISFGF